MNNNSPYHCKTVIEALGDLMTEGTISTIQVRFQPVAGNFLVTVKRDVYGDKPEIAFGSGGSAPRALSNMLTLLEKGDAQWRPDKLRSEKT